MNKYEFLFKEIFDATKDGKLKWKQTDKRANADIIFSPNTVFRQFSSKLIKGDDEFTLLFVEKKHEDPELFFDRYYPELLVLSEGELVTTLTDSIIEKSEMMKLADLLETKSDKAHALFAGAIFSGTGSATASGGTTFENLPNSQSK